jgi:proteasome maturation protein
MSFRQDAYLPAKQKSNLHLDILMGRDEMIEPADIFGGACHLCRIGQCHAISISGLETGNQMDIHREMERKLRL